MIGGEIGLILADYGCDCSDNDCHGGDHCGWEGIMW